jgi:hypothetical protein
LIAADFVKKGGELSLYTRSTNFKIVKTARLSLQQRRLNWHVKTLKTGEKSGCPKKIFQHDDFDDEIVFSNINDKKKQHIRLQTYSENKNNANI